MRLSKRQLKRIIREEYSRLKRQGLIQESRYEWMNQKRGAFPFTDDQWGSMPAEEKQAYGRWRFDPSYGAEPEPSVAGPEDKAYEVIEILEKNGIYNIDLSQGWEEDLEDGYPVDLIYTDDGSVAFSEVTDTSLSAQEIADVILEEH